MQRLARYAFGFALLALGSVALAQPPAAGTAAAAPGGDYYPLKAGGKWVYKNGELSITVKVASTDAEGTKLDTEVNGKTVASEVVKSTPEGIVRTKINNTAITPPVLILKLTGGKATKGDKWKIDSAIQQSAIKGEFTTKDDKEKVKVAAGEFDAVCVEGTEFDVAGTKTSVKYWFVAGKGIVKLQYTIAGNDSVLELKE